MNIVALLQERVCVPMPDKAPALAGPPPPGRMAAESFSISGGAVASATMGSDSAVDCERRVRGHHRAPSPR